MSACHAYQPAFGLIRSLLEPATAVYFEQLDFGKTDVIGVRPVPALVAMYWKCLAHLLRCSWFRSCAFQVCHLALNERLRAGISNDDLLVGTCVHRGE